MSTHELRALYTIVRVVVGDVTGLCNWGMEKVLWEGEKRGKM